MNLRDRAVDAVEIMDGADCDPVMLARTYADFRVVNAVVSGWRGIYRRCVRPALSTTRLTTLLDVGCGGGDLARALVRWADADGLRLEVTAIDPDERAYAWAVSRPPMRGLSFRAALSSELVAEGARFDFVVSNHVLHHLDPAQLSGLLADSEILVGGGGGGGGGANVSSGDSSGGTVLHADIARSRLAYLGFGAVTWPFFRSSFIRADGLTSIRRSFTPAELRREVPPGWQVTREHPSRLVLHWKTPAGVASAESVSAGAVSTRESVPPPGPNPNLEQEQEQEQEREQERESVRGSAARLRDVIVVGGGPVGILLAGLLAVRGVDVEVLERRTEPSLRSRAIGIHPPSLRALEQLGVADEVTARAVRIRGGVVRSDGRTLGRLAFSETAGQTRSVISLPQSETEAVLRARFAELSPGRLRVGVTVTGVRDRGDRVAVTTERTGLPDGETLEARYVVAADGAHSLVRDLLGIRCTARTGGETYLMSDYPDTGEYPGEAVLFFEQGGVVESFPLPESRRRWVAMTPALLPAATSDDLAALIRARTGMQLPATTAAASAFSVQQRLATNLVAGRVVLIGDAAHQISPIGGQGMNLGWLDALQLAPALEHALREPDAASGVLGAYDRRRRRSARMAARQAGFNMAMGGPVAGLRLRARNALVRTLAVPPASALLARAFTMRWL